MLNMRNSIFAAFLIALSGCVSGSVVAAPATPDAVAQQFEAAAYGNDFGAGSPVLLRWTVPMRFTVLAGEESTNDVRQLGLALQEIVNITRVPWKAARIPTDANLAIAFVRRDQFPWFVNKLGSKPEYVDEVVQTSACFGMIEPGEGRGTIKAVAVAIATDISDDRRRDCIPQELMQMMGLPGDTCHYRPSLICEDDLVFEMQPADKLMLAVLYDPDLQPGMTKDVAMPIVRRLIAKHWAEYMGSE